MKPLNLVQGKVEKMEVFADSTFDILSCIYLFNELPPESRRQSVQEFFRILKPGGIVCFCDSIQSNDRFDTPKLETFGHDFNVPHFESYLTEDLNQLFFAAGFKPGPTAPIIACSSKVLSWVKPDESESPSDVDQIQQLSLQYFNSLKMDTEAIQKEKDIEVKVLE